MLLLHPVASPSGFSIIQQGGEDLVGLGLPGSSSLDLDAASQGGAWDHILSRAMNSYHVLKDQYPLS